MGQQCKIFFITPTNKYQRSLSRYGARCPQHEYGCHASVVIDVIESIEHPVSGQIEWPRDDSRWPINCERCNNPIIGGEFLVHHKCLYTVPNQTDLYTLRDAPIGACWDADWYHDYRTGPDGRSLVVKCPLNHDWFIDGRASNCGSPDDDAHRCWVRHGKPEDGTLHVDKEGHTCTAGGGSIQFPGWHGVLRDGQLIEC